MVIKLDVIFVLLIIFLINLNLHFIYLLLKMAD